MNIFQRSLLQCGNYGIGGHYGTHPDFSPYVNTKYYYDTTSRVNRISTVMAVLEAPEAGNGALIIFQALKMLNTSFSFIGGATVWPFLGVSIFPEKGSAAMWFNTKDDAVPDYLTLYAACPVLLGQKWSKFFIGSC